MLAGYSSSAAEHHAFTFAASFRNSVMSRQSCQRFFSARLRVLLLAVFVNVAHCQQCVTVASGGVFDTIDASCRPVSVNQSEIVFFASTAGDDASKRTTLVRVNVSSGASTISPLSSSARQPKLLICDYACDSVYLLVDTNYAATPCQAAVSGVSAMMLRVDARAGPPSPPRLDAQKVMPAVLSSYTRPGRVNVPTPGGFTYAMLPRSFIGIGSVDVVRLAPMTIPSASAITLLATKSVDGFSYMHAIVALPPQPLAVAVVSNYQFATFGTSFSVQAWDMAGLVSTDDATSVVSLASVQLLDGSSLPCAFLALDSSSNGTVVVAFDVQNSAPRFFIVRGQRSTSGPASAVLTVVGQFSLSGTVDAPRLFSASLRIAFSSEGLRLLTASTLNSCFSKCTPYVMTAMLQSSPSGSLSLVSQGTVASFPAAAGGMVAPPLLGRSSRQSTGPDDAVAIFSYVDGSFAAPQVDAYYLPPAAPLGGIRQFSAAAAPAAMSAAASIAIQWRTPPAFAYVAHESGVLAQLAISSGLATTNYALLPLQRQLNDTDATTAVQLVTAPGLVVAISWRAPDTAVLQSYSDVDLTAIQRLTLTSVNRAPSQPQFDSAAGVIVWSDELPSLSATCTYFRTFRVLVTGTGAAATMSQTVLLGLTQNEMCFNGTAGFSRVRRVPLALSRVDSDQLFAMHAATNGTFSVLAVQVVAGSATGTSPASLLFDPQVAVPCVRGLVGWPDGQSFFAIGSLPCDGSSLYVRQIRATDWSSTLFVLPQALASYTTVFDGAFVYQNLLAAAPGQGLIVSFDAGYTNVVVNITSGSSDAGSPRINSTLDQSAFGLDTVTALVPPLSNGTVWRALVAPRLRAPAFLAQRSFSLPAALLPPPSSLPTPTTSSSSSPSSSPSRSVLASVTMSPSVSRSTTRSPSVARSTTPSPSVSPTSSRSTSVTASRSRHSNVQHYSQQHSYRQHNWQQHCVILFNTQPGLQPGLDDQLVFAAVPDEYARERITDCDTEQLANWDRFCLAAAAVTVAVAVAAAGVTASLNLRIAATWRRQRLCLWRCRRRCVGCTCCAGLGRACRGVSIKCRCRGGRWRRRGLAHHAAAGCCIRACLAAAEPGESPAHRLSHQGAGCPQPSSRISH